MEIDLRGPILIDGTVQHYDWGGYQYIPELIGEPVIEGRPYAELWLGTHPKGPSRLVQHPSESLRDLFDSHQRDLLGNKIAARYEGELPFLMKILDVRTMLSIQVHPSRESAQIGFAAENAAGISLTAPNRNYRDPNHKPEMAVALTDFYLLHGFKSEEAIRRELERIDGWQALLPILKDSGVLGLYRHVMELEQEAVNDLLRPLHRSLKVIVGVDKNSPDFWAQRAFDTHTKGGDYDRGVFSIYWFNLVRLELGQGIFQHAGVPHAYLEGVVVELMANSDNVLRGGLTTKHVDVPELLKHVKTEAIVPHILHPKPFMGAWEKYDSPIPDFQLARRELRAGHSIDLDASPAIYLLVKGGGMLGNGQSRRAGGAFFMPYDAHARFTATTDTELFCATVGQI